MEGLGKERRAGGKKKRGRIMYGRKWRRCTEDQKIEQRCAAMGTRELVVATRKPLMPGNKSLSEPYRDDISKNTPQS